MSFPKPPIQFVRDLAKTFTPGYHVAINAEAIAAAAPVVQSLHAKIRRPDGYTWPEFSGERFLGDLMLAAVNYCYFFGRADNIPAGSASRMDEIVRASVTTMGTYVRVRESVENAVRNTILARMPLADRRCAHLREISAVDRDSLWEFYTDIVDSHRDLNDLLKRLIVMLPGFAGDPFLKRALLFFQMLHRDYGLFSREQIAEMPIPTDYQVPKYLAHLGVLSYSPSLSRRIQNAIPLASQSRPEMEIRAHTIIAADQLAVATGLTTTEIDAALWLNRKDVTTPYHLTLTTDY